MTIVILFRTFSFMLFEGTCHLYHRKDYANGPTKKISDNDGPALGGPLKVGLVLFLNFCEEKKKEIAHQFIVLDCFKP